MAATDMASQVELDLRVNGTCHRLRLDVRTTLLDALREYLGLTGTKKGYDRGERGAWRSGRRAANLLRERTRCSYFRETSLPCNKRPWIGLRGDHR
jgi:hypothetical protein